MAIRLPPLPRKPAATPEKQTPPKPPYERCRKLREAAKRLIGMR